MANSTSQKTEDIDSVIEILLEDKKADSAVVIAEARQHPQKALKIIKDEKGEGKLVTYFQIIKRSYTNCKTKLCESLF